MREAADHFASAVRLAPGSAEAHYCLADALVELGRPTDAISHYESALQLKPGDAEIRARLEAIRPRR
jgi:Flp pilus assembly protein TadD